MYIRMTGGRDRGVVKDFSFVDAQELLASGQALPVNFEEPNPLETRILADEESLLVPTDVTTPQPVTDGLTDPKVIASMAEPTPKAALNKKDVGRRDVFKARR